VGLPFVAGWAVAMSAMMLPSELPLFRLYQLTPLKRRCLAICRAPLARILHGWRDGLGGAFRMGVENGLWCLGCCVGLTGALLALGMMSVGWMVVVGLAILVEKTTRLGIAASRGAAAALAVGAVAWAI
jgi:predicted metal-binding membrane protein